MARPRPAPAGSGSALADRGAGILAEQLRQALGRDAPAVVGDRDRDMHPVALGGDPDRRGLRRLPRGVRQQVVQHLLDALAVGHDARQVRRQVDRHRVAPAAGEEGGAALVHQRRHLRGLGRDRERAGVDAPGVEQVGDQADHAVGLVVDDADELAGLGRRELPRGAEQRAGRALDGGQRHAQLVAHHAEELGALALQLLERGEVLHGDHHRGDGAVLGVDRRGVDQRGHAAPVGDRERNFLGAHRLAAAQRARERELVEGDLAPVGAPVGDDLEQLLRRLAGSAQTLDDAPRLAVERDRAAGADVEHHDADRRGLDQRLEVGPRPLLGAVGARIGDRGRGLRGEEHQDLLVLVGEGLPALLLHEIEVADMDAAMAHRRALEGLRRQPVGGEAERLHIGRDVGDPERPLEVAEVLEEPRALGPLRHGPVLLLGEARGDEVLRRPRLVDGGDGAEAGAGQRPGALDHLAEHRLEVEARADPQARRAERRDALAQGRDLAAQFVGNAHRRAPAGGRIGVPGPGAGSARPGRFGEIPV